MFKSQDSLRPPGHRAQILSSPLSSPVAGVVFAVGRTIVVSLPVRNILADTSPCAAHYGEPGRVWAPLLGAALSRGPEWALCVLDGK